MVLCSLRSLLVAVIVLSNCITWTASRHHYTHNVSGHRSRHRRQGKGLYLSSSYVIPGGEGTGWGEWGEISPCSRTCGGGVASQKRICLQIGPDGQPQCTGGDTKYFSCETQDCPPGSGDFRAEQCSNYDDVEYRGIRYKWKPYMRGPNPCELNCMPHGERFYYRHQLKVIDGTRCNDDSFDVCVDGSCQPVGCDMMLGSNAREDKCRHCRGNGKDCYTTNGILDTQDLIKGYNDILLIPEGATTIVIMEVRPSNNYLALRAKNGTYYLNGYYHIDFPRSMMIAGALWFYERSQQGFPAPDKLRCLGPTKEPLYLSLLLQSENVGIEYEYSLPSERAPRPTQNYTWVHEDFTPCSAICGGGFQTRNVTCRTEMDLDLVDDALCDDGLKPVTNQTCNNDACPPQWVTDEWGPCSNRCGPDGTQSREVRCEKIIVNGFRSIVSDKECFNLLGRKPEKFRECNVNTTCPTWFTGPWKPCDKLYGEGHQTRQVVCYQKNGRRIDVLEDSECADKKPEAEKTCIIQTEEGTDWVASEWSGCDNCFSTVRTRVVKCSTLDRKLVNDSFCAHHPMPVLQEACDPTKLPPCKAQWYATQWGKCSTECGEGIQTRRVFCGMYVDNSVVEVEESTCDGLTKYIDKRPCTVPKELCPSQWFTAPWTECSKKCGGGERTRRVFCLRGDQLAYDCNGLEVPDSMEFCNEGPCNKDDIIALDSKSTPIIDEEDECEYGEEDYPEVGLDIVMPVGGLTTNDIMFSDTPSADIDLGSGFVFTTSFDEGSGSDFSSLVPDEFITTDEGSGSGSSSIFTEITESDTTSDYTSGFSDSTTEALSTVDEPSLSKSNISDIKTVREPVTVHSTIPPPTTISETESTDTDFTTIEDTTLTDTSTESSETTDFTEDATESTATDETGSSESNTISESTDMTESTENISTESNVTEMTDSSSDFATLSTSTEKNGGSESTLDTSTESKSDSGSSEFITEITTESSSSNTEESTTSGTSESTEDNETTAFYFSKSTITDETTIFGSSETTETEETTSSDTSASPFTEETTITDSSESTETEETTSSDTSASPFTEETTISDSSTSETEETTESGSTDATTTDRTVKTTMYTETESTLVSEDITTKLTAAEETTEPVSTEVISTDKITSTTMSTETDETSILEEVTSKSTNAAETTESVSAEDIATDETTISTISIETSGSVSTEELLTQVSSTTESTSTESISTESGATESVEVTELTTEKTTGSISTTEYSIEEGSTETMLSTKKEETMESTIATTQMPTESSAESSTFTTGSVEEGSTTEESSVTVITTDKSTTTGITLRSPWFTPSHKLRCKPRIKKCKNTMFGCCPDRRTAATGPYDQGCPRPETCKESQFGCCPDEVSPALGPFKEGCPTIPCAETLFGCCLSDNKTVAEGNDQEGCPPPPPACKSSTFGCCADEETEASGPDMEGCREFTTVSETQSTTEPEIQTESYTSSEASSTTTEILSSTSEYENCTTSTFGCCYDQETPATGPQEEGCPCSSTEFGCCPDGISTARGAEFEGCVVTCSSSRYGCCSDGKTPAHGPQGEGCCLLSVYGCCPDNYKSAEGPHLEGCGCQYSRFGCCPDNVTIARGPNVEGCGCQYTEYGCCPDRHTEAPGPNYEGCGCHTYQFGCCPDGVTVSKGPNQQGCDCRESQYGCCGDGKTPATGPDRSGCNCATSEFGCCPDGQTEAKGHRFLGCTDIPENRQAACGLPTDRGSCRNFSVHWYYDLEYGGCSRFWYGGCEGNGNRFTTKEECEDVCVQPSPKDACNLPKVKGACMGYNVRWYYDSEKEHCNQFIFGGCLGNANNFASRELCLAQCQPERTEDQCRLPIERGSCAGNFGRWGFKAETRRCEQFIWGGCEGNPNRFSSEAACLQRCDPPGKLKPQCMEEQNIGNCTEKEPAWFFSQTEGRCVPFYYSGCGGNGNRFDSEQSCAQTCPSAYVPEMCTMPAEVGDCADYRERWYFDTTEKRCRQFYYGGCGGNGNNFASQLECEGRCSEAKATTTVQPAALHPNSDMCFMEADPGSCSDLQTRWMYDQKLGRCVTFEYTGCGGNRNNFPSERHCQYYCNQAQDICQLPMLSGPCNDSIMSWFYDPSSDSCSQFTYGGCDGNDNRFDTRDDCERRCRTGAGPTTLSPTTSSTVRVDTRFGGQLPSECTISPSVETCERSGQVWYLDRRLGECVAHENQDSGDSCRHTGVFQTQEACERTCGVFRNINVCSYDVDPGPCTTYVAKYYFDKATSRCREFAYGGCTGGPNRFSTIDECQEVCKNEMADPCKQDAEPGDCTSRYIMWYYDKSRDECLQFIYGGCHGNDNRFETRENCERKCRQRPSIASTTTTLITTTTTTMAPMTTVGQPLEEECRTPESLVPCGENITVYYYEHASRSCIPSDIGGCRYANSYRTEEECERRCGVFRDINVCEARLDPGPCRASIPKYYWEPASGSCLQFAYGGCGGGANRFSTIEECEEICGNTGPAAACKQPVSTGSGECGSPSRRWYYSVLHADCLVFAYQGCAGTANNFLSYDECADLCNVSRLPDEGGQDCAQYDDECLQLVCPEGLARERTPEGCTRCSCVEKTVDCGPLRTQCEELRCPYGLQRSWDSNGCEKCECLPDPCIRERCPFGESCVAIARKHPITEEPQFFAVCKPGNDVLPDCDQFNDECSRLRCEYGVQRTRTVDGCERCTCVQVEIDCAPLRLECEQIRCNYLVERQVGPDGCERCRCSDPPCKNVKCSPGERCVEMRFRDPITQESRFSTECRTINKTGYCPVVHTTSTEGPCHEECHDDAECRGVGKCCARGCSRVCVLPDEPTPALPYTTTHAPDLPQSPQVSHETEPEVAAEEGGKATLRCIFHGNPPPKITWRRGEITIDSDIGRYRLLSDGALEIVSVYRNDSGVYICVAENNLGTARQEIQLKVKDPVESPAGIAGEQKQELIGVLGKGLVIRCLTYGYPQPTVSWHRGLYGSMVPYSSSLYEARDNVLIIRRLTYDTVGEYACQAYNGRGRPASWLVVVKAHQTDDVQVGNPYILPRIREPDEAIQVKVMEATPRSVITFTTTTSTTPEPEIDNRPIFTVPVHTKISARGSSSLTVGSELNLECEVDGYPEPDLFWSKDNKRIIPNDNIRISGTSLSRLTVSHVSLDDAGTYECHAQNDYSSHFSYMQITVQPLSIPAKCTDSPFFANCPLIVRSKFCQHKYYSKFCCKSCLEAGQLSAYEVEMQADQPLVKRK